MTLHVYILQLSRGGGHILEGMGVCSVHFFGHDDVQKKQENLIKKLM